MKDLASQEIIESKIYLIRGQKVMLDKDLALVYGIPTKALVQAVKRNIRRFPDDFMIVLTEQEFGYLRSQFVTSSWGGRRYPPYAFTEHGVAMLSSVLNSERAISVNIVIMRTFARLRHMFAVHKNFSEKLDRLEHKTKKHDEDILIIFKAIRMLTAPSNNKPRIITGFKPKPSG
jgi:hypothetical protein